MRVSGHERALNQSAKEEESNDNFEHPEVHDNPRAKLLLQQVYALTPLLILDIPFRDMVFELELGFSEPDHNLPGLLIYRLLWLWELTFEVFTLQKVIAKESSRGREGDQLVLSIYDLAGMAQILLTDHFGV